MFIQYFTFRDPWVPVPGRTRGQRDPKQAVIQRKFLNTSSDYKAVFVVPIDLP